MCGAWGGGDTLSGGAEGTERQRVGLWLCARGHIHVRQPKALHVPRQTALVSLGVSTG